MMDSGRRIGMALSHVMCTKLPGRAWAAHLDAATRSTNCFASWACCEMTRALSRDRKSTRLNSSHSQISYAVFCLKKKKKNIRQTELTIRCFRQNHTD